MFYLDRGGLPPKTVTSIVPCKNAYKRKLLSSRLRQMTTYLIYDSFYNEFEAYIYNDS